MCKAKLPVQLFCKSTQLFGQIYFTDRLSPVNKNAAIHYTRTHRSMYNSTVQQ